MLRRLTDNVMLPIFIASFAVCVSLLLWMNGLYVNADMLTFGLLSGTPWHMVQVGPAGEVSQSIAAPVLTAFLLGLSAVSVIAFFVGLTLLPRAVARPALPDAADTIAQLKLVDNAGLQLQGEMRNVASVIDSQIDLNSRHTGWLGEVSQSLPSLTTPEQVSKIVLALITQNDEVQAEVLKLREKLETSQLQVEKLRETLADAEEVGMRDALTTLHNRRWLDTHMADTMAEAKAGSKPLSLIVADLDHFKKINDTHGHLVGDDVLRRFAQLIVKNIKGRDFAVRFGGEEFVIVLPDTPVEGAHAITEQLRCELESKKWVITKGGQDLGTVTASFGVTQLLDADNLETLIGRADAGLYEAKRAGRNRVVVK